MTGSANDHEGQTVFEASSRRTVTDCYTIATRRQSFRRKTLSPTARVFFFFQRHCGCACHVKSIPLIPDLVFSSRSNDWHGRRANEVFNQRSGQVLGGAWMRSPPIGRGGGARCPVFLPISRIRRRLRTNFPCNMLGRYDISAVS